MYHKLLEIIKESDMLLIGLGNEVSLYKKLNLKENIEKIKLNEIITSGDEEVKSQLLVFYNNLESIISQKNYFIITTNVDGVIYESNINQMRIVAPCGNVNKLQCRCGENIINIPDNYYKDNLVIKCQKCDEEYTPNIFNKVYYNEEGYLRQWNLYNKWLQGTLNKKLLILELGCDFSWLSIIRMPFEKIAMINHKAEYYRVSEKFPQITAELKDKMFSIADNPFDFVKSLIEAEHAI